ncbi:MAG: Gfo/Idh/MocA family oxidoreductase [Pseudomonadales bacterium]|nr:Gfo/Idh/MocA family oxidoreductase [Gammaproteobacteria bacterium]MBP6051963.1 Gfo/Idh/MocA family oxidoreductase [Pseudomonadales bacterium]MBK6581816.1 Gfo/Idh/MocA family oxidoreductase [Gammaproteobacteria bacterium]MBK7169477.1 Gfo/Idh/MocA family oxidoreductase [Gammaproteobacteria bacterium]MBK8308362.1 Gfo/Idh/MocA family oxidoreductase [Gammaproteobacteria bacterium]
MSARRIPLGFIGGGPRSLIGGVHRAAVMLSGEFELRAGVFGTDQARGRAFAERIGVAAGRSYADLEEMLAGESRRAPGERIEVVSVLTPNHLHFPMVDRLLDAGLHVFCEKPLSLSVVEALALERKAVTRGCQVGVAHTYTGYPMVRQMRALIAGGAIGAVQKIDVQYYQGWINPAMHDAALRDEVWRLDPARSGPSCCIGDIGVHAFDLVEYATGLRIRRVLAELDSFGPGKALDVDGTVLFHTDNGVRGLLRASQIATGEENNLRIAVYGRSGALRWCQEQAAELLQLRENGPRQLYTPGHGFNTELARMASQLPPGHPQGLAEAMANLYRGFADGLRGIPGADTRYRDIGAGVRGMRFIEAALASSRDGSKWTDIERVQGQA